MELFVGAQSKTDYLAYAQGIIILIANTSSYPLLQDDGYYLPAARYNQIQVQRVYAYKLDAPYSSCIKDTTSANAYHSTYFKKVVQQSSVYSQKLCIRMCYQLILMANCSCQDPSTISADASYTKCSNSTQLDCRNSIRSLLYDGSFIENNCLPFCPKECDTIDYQYTITGATFPSPYYADYLINSPKSPIKSYFNATSSYTDVANSVMIVSGIS